GLFEHAQVGGQVAVGQPQEVLEVAEVDLGGLGQGGENAEAAALVHDVFQPASGVIAHTGRMRTWARSAASASMPIPTSANSEKSLLHSAAIAMPAAAMAMATCCIGWLRHARPAAK